MGDESGQRRRRTGLLAADDELSPRAAPTSNSRLAYVELHDDEKVATVTGFVERDLAFFAEHGVFAKRLITTQPYRPRTNGKVERFHQTMAREWA